MKSQLLLFIFLLSTIPSYSQSKMTDREMDGLLGKVKTVKEEWKEIKTYPGQKLKTSQFFISQYTYDADGRQLETLNENGSKTVYAIVDGFRTFTTVSAPSLKGDMVMEMRAIDEPDAPIEKNEKITDPDKRFEFKITYEYDDKGRVITERGFKNNGKLWYLKTFKYGENGKVSEELRNDTVAITKYTFTYDKKGLLIESVEERDIKGRGTDSTEKIVYSKYIVDHIGNWTSRQAHTFSSRQGLPESNIPPDKWDIIRAEYRTITYH